MKQLLTILLIIFAISVNAQRNTYPLSGIQVEYKPAIGDTSLYNCKVQVTLQDTTNISKLLISMGSQSGLSDIFQKQFTYDESGTLSDGTSYTRVGKKITLGLGTFSKMAHFYGTVQVQKNDNSITDPITFSK